MNKPSRWPWAGLVAGILLTLAPVPGIVAGLLTMFASLGDSGRSHSEAEISAQVGAGLWILIITFLLCPIGLGIMIWSIVVLVKRRRARKRESLPNAPG